MCYPGYVVEINDLNIEDYHPFLEAGMSVDKYNETFADWHVTIKQISAGFMSHLTGNAGNVITEIQMPLFQAEELIETLQRVIANRKVKYKTIIQNPNVEIERKMWIDIMDKLKEDWDDLPTPQREKKTE